MEFASEHVFLEPESESGTDVTTGDTSRFFDLLTDLKQYDDTDEQVHKNSDTSNARSDSVSSPESSPSSVSSSSTSSSSEFLAGTAAALRSLYNRNQDTGNSGLLPQFKDKAGNIQVVDKTPLAPRGPTTHTRNLPKSFGALDASDAPDSSSSHIIRDRLDSNILAVKFGALAEDAEQINRNPCVFCKNCQAALSATSTVLKYEAAKQVQSAQTASLSSATCNDFTLPELIGPAAISSSPSSGPIPALSSSEFLWTCEFCSHANVLSSDNMPRTNTCDYILAQSSVVSSDSKSEVSVGDEGLVLFVLDISNSMCSTMSVPGHFKLKGDKRGTDKEFNLLFEPKEMAAPQHVGTVTYVSRLQCIQAAVDQQIEWLSKSHPSKHVGVITFSNKVTVYGDGMSDVAVVEGEDLQKQEALFEFGRKMAVSRPVSEVRNKLSDIIFGLQESGQTALGPGLTVAVAMASKVAGSRVIICTDGLSNVGVGCLDGTANDDVKRQEVVGWYEGMGAFAKDCGVTVSVVSIKGQDSSLEDLGQVVELTGGAMEKVDPLMFAKDFNNILQNPLIAINVNVVVILHQGLRFRLEAQADAEAITNVVKKELGNVTSDSELILEYGINPEKRSLVKNLSELPFQLQIVSTKLNGMKCLRVISRVQPITLNRNVAENNVRLNLLAANAAQQSARYAEVGDYERAQTTNISWTRFMSRLPRNSEQQSSFSRWLSFATPFQQSLQVQGLRLSNALNSPIASPMSSSGMPVQSPASLSALMSSPVRESSAASFALANTLNSPMAASMSPHGTPVQPPASPALLELKSSSSFSPPLLSSPARESSASFALPSSPFFSARNPFASPISISSPLRSAARGVRTDEDYAEIMQNKNIKSDKFK